MPSIRTTSSTRARSSPGSAGAAARGARQAHAKVAWAFSCPPGEVVRVNPVVCTEGGSRYCSGHEHLGGCRFFAQAGRLCAPAADRGLAVDTARALRAASRRGHTPVRVRRPVAVPGAAGGGGPAGRRGAGARHHAAVQTHERADRGARRGDRSVGRGHAARAGRAAGAVQAQPYQAHRPRRRHGRGRAGRAQPGHFRSRRALRALLHPRTHPARSPVRSAATWPRTPAAYIASSTG